MKFFKKTSFILCFCLLVILPVLSACSGGPSAQEINATSTAIAGTAFAAAWTQAAAAMPAATATPSEPDPTPTLEAPTAIPAPSFTWQVMTIDTGKVGPYSSLAIDHSGMPHIIYLDDTRDDLKYATVKDGAWKLQNFDSPNNDGYIGSLVLDSSDRPHFTRFIWGVNWIVYAYWAGAAWEYNAGYIPDVQAVDTALVLDAEANPHVIYFDALSSELRHSVKNAYDTSWTTQVIDRTQKTGETFPAAIDANGKIHVAYHDETAGLKYASLEGDSWAIQVVDPGPAIGIYPSLALDPQGYPHISYRNNQTYALRHAYWNGAAWVVEDVDPAGGIFTSIAVSADGAVHIAYYDDLGKAVLRYAVGKNGQWSVMTVDDTANVGKFCSLALNPTSGVPAISYYDHTNRSLKLAIAAPN